ncbi:MAG: hypothetical protein HYV26_14215, partial [Candidatus Hydrogenedentes bacterium]|nr:hypothetical protein [Candidatus Hydrogenedentota bacterium]
DLPRRRVLARSSLAALLPCMTAPARAEVMRDLTCLGLNVEAHRAEHGELPRALEEVMPAQQLPLDPFGGQHYRYLHTQEGFFLYSLGPDGVDDGGKQTEDSPLHVEQGDITWRASR